MTIRVGLETNVEGKRCLAWMLDFPGFHTWAGDGPSALLILPQELARLAAWTREKSGRDWLGVTAIDIRLVETFRAYEIPAGEAVPGAGTEINAWFADDARPYDRVEAKRAVEILTWTREDLLLLVNLLSREALMRVQDGERWSIEGILGHLADAEWWYLNRMGAGGEREVYPPDTISRMKAVRESAHKTILDLANDDQVRTVEGEKWSARKMMRRIIWHELDHIRHIRRLMGIRGD